jgi:hypothetical protein
MFLETSGRGGGVCKSPSSADLKAEQQRVFRETVTF